MNGPKIGEIWQIVAYNNLEFIGQAWDLLQEKTFCVQGLRQPTILVCAF